MTSLSVQQRLSSFHQESGVCTQRAASVTCYRARPGRCAASRRELVLWLQVRDAETAIATTFQALLCGSVAVTCQPLGRRDSPCVDSELGDMSRRAECRRCGGGANVRTTRSKGCIRSSRAAAWQLRNDGPGAPRDSAPRVWALLVPVVQRCGCSCGTPCTPATDPAVPLPHRTIPSLVALWLVLCDRDTTSSSAASRTILCYEYEC